jgi:predicted Na+-dependent transporter
MYLKEDLIKRRSTLLAHKKVLKIVSAASIYIVMIASLVTAFYFLFEIILRSKEILMWIIGINAHFCILALCLLSWLMVYLYGKKTQVLDELEDVETKLIEKHNYKLD